MKTYRKKSNHANESRAWSLRACCALVSHLPYGMRFQFKIEKIGNNSQLSALVMPCCTMGKSILLNDDNDI